MRLKGCFGEFSEGRIEVDRKESDVPIDDGRREERLLASFTGAPDGQCCISSRASLRACNKADWLEPEGTNRFAVSYGLVMQTSRLSLTLRRIAALK